MMKLQKFGAELAALVSYGFLTSSATAAYDVDSLDAAILQDVLESYANHEPTSCSGAAGSTTFTFAYPGVNTASEWNTVFKSFEEDVFLAAMSLDDPIGKRSCTIRIGKGGNMYSHFCPDMHGETFPPQFGDESPWVDEVHQSVSVNNALNGKPDMCNGGQCPKCFVHGAGTYQRDSPYTDVPFFGQSLAKYCAGDSCIFAAWGQQAHVATIFTSSVMMFNKYTNCGNGVIEHTQMIHNFAPEDTQLPASHVDQNFFNVPWGGVRRSNLPIVLEPNYSTGELRYEDPSNVDYCLTCPWNKPDHDKVGGDQDMGRGRCARALLRDTGGYTTFVEPGLLVNHELPAIQKHKWCRKPNANCNNNPSTCMAPPSECFDSNGNPKSGYTPVRLIVPAGKTPECKGHKGLVEGYQTLKCKMRATGFGQTTPYLHAEESVDECAPWLGAEMGLYRADNGEGIKIPYLRHWSWNPGDQYMFFSVYSQNLNEAINLVNNKFDNRSSGKALSILFNTFEPGQDQTNAGPDYNPAQLNSVTYVYGKGEDYSAFGGSVPGKGRRRIGSANRDYNVFTVNWMSTGAKLKPGDTYSNRSFVVASNLGSAKSTADSLRRKVVADKINLERWNPRAIDIYKSGTAFDAVAAAAVGGGSTMCTRTSATLECSGYSTPHPGHVPFFYITCGASASSYLGPDPYHFTPGNGDWFRFPGMSNNNGKKIRSYACAGEVASRTRRPKWKLIGFFNPATCTSLGADVTFDDNICNDPADPPPTPVPTNAPTTARPTLPPSPSAMHTGTDGCRSSGTSHSDTCFDNTALKAVNCCSGSQSDGSLSCSRPNCFDGQKMNFADAVAHCESFAMRLCTVDELKSNVCCSKGCGFDSDMGWSADSCTMHTGTDGCPTSGTSYSDTCLDDTTLKAVNCCSGSQSDGNLSCSRPDCFTGQKMSFTDAVAHCESYAMRLCTVDELKSNVCCSKGCNMDSEMGWSADNCGSTLTPTPMPVPLTSPSPTSLPTPGPTTTTDAQTPDPTPSRSSNPTSLPTSGPTTALPTSAPTQEPSSNPTPLPTHAPTTATEAQTPGPTQAPSSNPTSLPPSPSAMHTGTDGCRSSGTSHSDTCFDNTALKAVNCCSGSQSDGSLSCSRPNCFDGQKMNFADAVAHCESFAMRLCTVDELKSNVCCSKGCGFDSDMGWSADSCTMHTGTDGCPSSGTSYSDTCLIDTKLKAVNCCSGSQSDGNLFCSRPDCFSGQKMSFADAVAHCESYEMRLCTVDELKSNVCCSKGCNMDSEMGWSADNCGSTLTPTPMPVPLTSPSPTSLPTPGPTTTTDAQTPDPTPSRSSNPTSLPTSGPTTALPTSAPTQEPSSNPTPLPTHAPTTATEAQTPGPTQAPSSNPTSLPPSPSAMHTGTDGCRSSGTSHSDTCFDNTALKAVNCCSGSQGDGSLSCSRPNCFDGQKMNFADAVAHCESFAMRLCTVDELKSNVCCSQGCGFDSDTGWSADSCTMHTGTDSCPTSGTSYSDTCLIDTKLKAVNCCSGSQTAGNLSCSRPDCFKGQKMSFIDAVAHCESYAMRLCTVDELKSNVCCSKGCNMDSEMGWSADNCGSI